MAYPLKDSSKFWTALSKSIVAGILLSVTVVLLGCTSRDALPMWTMTTLTNDADSLGYDVRRPMSVGLYDKTVDKTFACYTGKGMVPVVTAYDHVAENWGEVLAVHIPDRSTDSHDYPHLFMSADGHLHITYSRHNESLWISTSEHPHSIEGYWTTREIGSQLKATYPMPIKGADGTLYILYRVTLEPTDYRPIKWVKSTDNGATWSDPVPCIDYNNSRTDHMNEIYLGQMSYEPNHPTFGEGYSTSWTLAGGGPHRHDHDDFHKNMYYAFFSMSNAHWRAANGTNLGLNIDDAEAELHCKVYDSGALVGNRELRQTQDIGYISAATCDTHGVPFVAFSNGKKKSVDIARWDGKGWTITTPPSGKKTLRFHDMNRINGKLLLLLSDKRDVEKVLELKEGHWQDIATYHPEIPVWESMFIDSALPEVLFLTSNNREAVYSVGYALEKATSESTK